MAEFLSTLVMFGVILGLGIPLVVAVVRFLNRH